MIKKRGNLSPRDLGQVQGPVPSQVGRSRWDVFRHFSLCSTDIFLWYDHRQLWTQSLLNTLSGDAIKENILALAGSYVVFGSLMLGIGAAGLCQAPDGTALGVSIYCFFGLFCLINLWLTVINVVLTIMVSSVDPVNIRFWCKGNITLLNMVGRLVLSDVSTVEAIFILIPIRCLRGVEPPIVQTVLVCVNTFLVVSGHLSLCYYINTASRMITHSGCQSQRRLIDEDWVLVSDFTQNEAQLAGMSIIHSEGFALLSSKEGTDEHFEAVASTRSNGQPLDRDAFAKGTPRSQLCWRRECH